MVKCNAGLSANLNELNINKLKLNRSYSVLNLQLRIYRPLGASVKKTTQRTICYIKTEKEK
jgi:hypothetical protein